LKVSDRVYFKGIDGLRAIGALSVVLGHIELSKKSVGIENLMEYSFYKNTSGHLGVLLFFVLSGFLISYLLFKEKAETNDINILSFYKRRALRIWPIYYLVVILLFFVFPFIIEFDYFGKPNWEFPMSNLNTLLIYFLIVPNLVSFGFGGLGGGFQLGSIGTEEQFYLFWPWLIKKFKCVLYPILGIMIFIPLVPHLCDFLSVHYFGKDESAKLFLRQLGDFFSYFKINCMATGGLIAWIYFKKIEKLLNLFYSKVFQIIVLILAFGGWLSGFHLNYFSDEYYSVLFAIIILNTATNPKSIVSFDTKLLNYLGKISYGIYVYHWIVIYFFMDLFMPLKTDFWIYNLLLYFCSISVTLVVSHFSYFYFEIMFLKLKEKFAVIKSNKKI
jgi:peptidoglycan/LPS O-acetylase OafA/YrhL